MSGISALVKETRELPHPSSLCGNRGKTAVYELGSGLLPETEFAGALIVNFQPPDLR